MRLPTNRLRLLMESAPAQAMNPDAPSGKIDSKITQWASNSYYNDYLKAGIRGFAEYKRVVLHSRPPAVDGKWSIIGSAGGAWISFEDLAAKEKMARRL